MKKFFLVILAVALTGCDLGYKKGDVRVVIKSERWCQKDNTALQEFIRNCIKDANPNSDEEPEDWIRQCQYTGERIACPVTTLLVTERCSASSFGGCDFWRDVDVRPATPEQLEAFVNKNLRRGFSE